MTHGPEEIEVLSPLDEFLESLSEEDAADVNEAVLGARGRGVSDKEIFAALTGEVEAGRSPVGEPEPTA